MKISVKYSELYKQVLGLVLIPLFYTGVFLAAMVLIDRTGLSEAVITIIIFAGTFLLIGLSVVTILKVIMVKGEMEYDMKGIHFHLKKRSFLYPHDEFFISYPNIESAAMNEDSAGRSFSTIKIKSPQKSIVISPDHKDQTGAFVFFWQTLEQNFSNYNESNTDHSALLIKNKGFYESNYIKGLAAFSALLAVFFAFVKIMHPDSVSLWKLIAFYCYVLPFLFTVVRSNTKSNY